MTALILLSHGSRVDESNQEMLALADTMAGIDNIPFEHIRCAFLQFSRPTFEAVVDDLVREGLQRIVVFPLFLSSGSHVQVDVPEMIQGANRRYPQLQLRITPHLGGINGLAGFLLKSVVQYS